MKSSLPKIPGDWPDSIKSEEALDEILTRPRETLLRWIQTISGRLIILGAGGKMGPSLCVLAQRAAKQTGRDVEVVAVSRFSSPNARDWLAKHGVRTIGCDLLDPNSFATLPDSSNLIYLVGMKFGTQQTPWLTWAINTLIPSYVISRYRHARIVAVSSGNIYPFMPVDGSGATEVCLPDPVGEYANAALARERIFEHGSHKEGTPVVKLRLNYAVELRYGVLVDIAQKVWHGEALDVSTGYFNCLWQGDANDRILRSLDLVATPPALFNLTGASKLSVRAVASRFAEIMGRPLRIQGSELATALLSDSSRLCARLGPPETDLDQVIAWTAGWVMDNHSTLGKPTHFEVRSGNY